LGFLPLFLYVNWFYKSNGKVRMLDKFQEGAEAVGAIVKRYTSVADAVAYVKELAGKGGMLATHLPEEIREGFSGTAFALPEAAAQAYLCVSFAKAGIAATGSLLLDVADPQERSFTALPPVHAVFIKASSLVPDLYAIHDLLASELAAAKTAYLSLTTGPSRTADIERVLTIGVHGPKELHVLVLEGE
jgi:L-lactate dehydrogenase complex protein LldG